MRPDRILLLPMRAICGQCGHPCVTNNAIGLDAEVRALDEPCEHWQCLNPGCSSHLIKFSVAARIVERL